MRPSSESLAAANLYRFSPYRVPAPLIRAVATIKIATAQCNRDLGYLPADTAEAIIAAAKTLSQCNDQEVARMFPLDAFQGGAGTSTHMAVNEWIAERAANSNSTVGGGGHVDAHNHVNLFQSTNDVMPTALRLMMLDLLQDLEQRCLTLQAALQHGERRFEGSIKIGRTQLRDAVVTSLGREFATWAHTVARDRWRCFKARERVREVNIGGTAIGTGAGAPRRYCLSVIRFLQDQVDHPISRADHLGEATSNFDQVVEAMDAVRCCAVSVRRVASDIRLLASGPECGFGELIIPNLVPGSSIMAGKVNPVIPEGVIQCAERVLANDSLISRLASMSELELNTFLPTISHTVFESCYIIGGAITALADYVPLLKPNERTFQQHLRQSQAVALLPLVPYDTCAALVQHAEHKGCSLAELLVGNGVFSSEEAQQVFSPEHLLSLGYNEDLYGALRATRRNELERLVKQCTTGQLGEPL